MHAIHTQSHTIEFIDETVEQNTRFGVCICIFIYAMYYISVSLKYIILVVYTSALYVYSPLLNSISIEGTIHYFQGRR